MFITLEGTEGAGKTTQLPHLVRFLEDRGHDCVVTREPGGTPTGLKIRGILLDPANHGMTPEAELFLYAADRAQHVGTVIRPALDAGKTVICDRFIDATEAYQGAARGLDRELISLLNRVATGGLKPDLTILFDLPPETGLERAWERINRNGNGAADHRFETEDINFHNRVRDGYLAIAAREPERFVIINADGSEEDVRKALLAGVGKRGRGVEGSRGQG
ncbi:MAG: dTMP kinase [Thermodesulfobacteriota bacterium]